MLSEICETVHNFFTSPKNKMHGNYSISGGVLVVPFLKNGQYFRIIGSAFNDGVYQYPVADLIDEEFNGEIWAMSVPPSFIALCKDIEEYSKGAAAKTTPFQSESFEGYSYSRKEDAAWEKAFKSKLDKYRRLPGI